MNELLTAITPALADALALIASALACYLITYINKKKVALQMETENERAKAYMDLFEETITKCVKTTNQTFVETLKKDGLFDKEAQEEAFNRTLKNVKAVLSEDCLKYLAMMTADVNTFIYTAIESEVNWAKKI
jgi:hypothetical protein